jgi:hypothetical protein
LRAMRRRHGNKAVDAALAEVRRLKQRDHDAVSAEGRGQYYESGRYITRFG